MPCSCSSQPFALPPQPPAHKPVVFSIECMTQACEDCKAACKQDTVSVSALSTPLSSAVVLDFLQSNMHFFFTRALAVAHEEEEPKTLQRLSEDIRSSAVKTRLIGKLDMDIGSVLKLHPRPAADTLTRKIFMTCRCDGDDVLLYLSLATLVMVF